MVKHSALVVFCAVLLGEIGKHFSVAEIVVFGYSNCYQHVTDFRGEVESQKVMIMFFKETRPFCLLNMFPMFYFKVFIKQPSLLNHTC